MKMEREKYEELRKLVEEVAKKLQPIEWYSVRQVSNYYNVTPQAIYYRLRESCLIRRDEDYIKIGARGLLISANSLYKFKPVRENNRKVSA